MSIIKGVLKLLLYDRPAPYLQMILLHQRPGKQTNTSNFAHCLYEYVEPAIREERGNSDHHHGDHHAHQHVSDGGFGNKRNDVGVFDQR